MTQADIDAIKQIESEKMTLIDQHQNRIYQLNMRLEHFKSKCDHKYPDGSSAKNLFCLICGGL